MISALTAADLPALAALAARSLADPPDARLLGRLLLAEPDPRPELQLALRRADVLVGVALGSLRPHAGLISGGPRLLLVDPASRRRGYGGLLLGELERRLLAAGATELRAGNLAPNYLWPGVEASAVAAHGLLRAMGYGVVGETLNMTVDLAARDWLADVDASGWGLRRPDAAEGPRLAAWAVERWGASWGWEVAAACAADPPTILIAEHGGEPGGFACWDVSGFWATFGPTGVDESLRGRGLGRALLHAALAALAAAGHRQAEIGWVGPQEFYAHAAAARPGRACLLYTKPAPP